MTAVFDTVAGPKSGLIAVGRVEFRNVYFRDSADHTKTVSARTVPAPLDAAGAFSIELEPGPYVFRRVVEGGEDRGWRDIDVPASGSWRLMVLQLAYSGAPASTSDLAALIATLDARFAPIGSTLTAYDHVQSTPAASWSIVHNLGRYPAAVNIIIGTEEVEADVNHPSVTQTVITFPTPTSGRAELI